MGRELASAAARWMHLADLGVRPRLVLVCDPSADARAWYERLDPPPRLVADYRDLLADDEVEAVYCAVPHHLHEELYVAVLAAGQAPARREAVRDRPARRTRRSTARSPPRRCSSAARPSCRSTRAARRSSAGSPSGRYGRVLEVRSQFLHSSDLDPRKPINWKRIAARERRVRLPRRPRHARAAPAAARRLGAARTCARSSRTSSPSGPARTASRSRATRGTTPSCSARRTTAGTFPLRIETKRIAPGETNTWTIEVDGTEGSIAFTTKLPKTLRTMSYEPGGRQEWRVTDLGSRVRLPDDHRRDLRVRLLRRGPADVGRVLRRARPRPRRHAAAVPLRDAGGGGGDASPLHRGAALARRARRRACPGAVTLVGLDGARAPSRHSPSSCRTRARWFC